MSRIKSLSSLIYSTILLILISIVLTSFQFRFLMTSFKINSSGQQIPIFGLLPNLEAESLLTRTTRIHLKNRILEDSGYTLSFFIKTGSQSLKETLLFNSTDKRFGSIYWNVSLVDGKIETARTAHIPPIITDQKINDNQWHHILVTTSNNEEKIFINNKLGENTLVYYLKISDDWFVINVNPNLIEDDQIHLKDFIFINKNLTPPRFEIFQNYFSGNHGPLYRLIFFSLMINLLIIVSLYVFLVFIIKSNYPDETAFSITDFLSSKLFLFLLGAFSFWTGYGYQISLLLLFVFFYCLLQSYKNIFPPYLSTFVNTPISFLFKSLRLLRQVKLKELFLYATSQKPKVYFCLFLFLGLLFSFNRFLFTNNLFRY